MSRATLGALLHQLIALARCGMQFALSRGMAQSQHADSPSDRGARVGQSLELMLAFAERTGLASGREPRRYLWTDAFAVANFLELAHLSADPTLAQLAARLIEQVHHTLGRHRPDSSRAGWLSGLAAEEGARHPTRAGLRIGKPLPEREAGASFDERLEWDRDGQYLHYLTQWMSALDLAACALERPQLNVWARELAEVAHRAFLRQGPGGAHLVWKMSSDLSRPLIDSSGQLDALDLFVRCAELRTSSFARAGQPEGPRLEQPLSSLAAMLPEQHWVTTDALGIGGLLVDACRVQQLMLLQRLPKDDLLRRLLAAAFSGLREYRALAEYALPVAQRLAFRELGLALGCAALELMRRQLRQQHQPSGYAVELALLDALAPYVPFGASLRDFWSNPRQRDSARWQQHRDINDVMLATSLLPEGWLVLRCLKPR